MVAEGGSVTFSQGWLVRFKPACHGVFLPVPVSDVTHFRQKSNKKIAPLRRGFFIKIS